MFDGSVIAHLTEQYYKSINNLNEDVLIVNIIIDILCNKKHALSLNN